MVSHQQLNLTVAEQLEVREGDTRGRERLRKMMRSLADKLNFQYC